MKTRSRPHLIDKYVYICFNKYYVLYISFRNVPSGSRSCAPVVRKLPFHVKIASGAPWLCESTSKALKPRCAKHATKR